MFKKNKTFQTSKPILSNPIHLKNKVIIPVCFVNVTSHRISTFGCIDTKGIVIIENQHCNWLPLDESFELDHHLKQLPELQKILSSVNNN